MTFGRPMLRMLDFAALRPHLAITTPADLARVSPAPTLARKARSRKQVPIIHARGRALSVHGQCRPGRATRATRRPVRAQPGRRGHNFVVRPPGGRMLSKD